MSSFIIDKKSYARAAGYVAGLVERFDLFIWHRSKGKKYDDEMLYNSFAHLYEMNFESVCSQYDIKNREKDRSEYAADFYNVKKTVVKIDRKEFDSFALFASSVIYQIEDDDMQKQAEAFLYKIISRIELLFSEKRPIEDEYTWGKF